MSIFEVNKPFEIKRKYKKGFQGRIDRRLKEPSILKRGYYVFSEQEVKEYSGGKGCLLAIIFLPLALLGGVKYLEVTYRLK